MDPYNSARDVAELWLRDVEHYLERGDCAAALDQLRSIETKILQMARHKGVAVDVRADSFVTFVEQIVPKTRKTKVFAVHATGGELLGIVKWYPAWRCYSFYTLTDRNTIFERACLHDIARFCEAQTITHKIKR
jgi:hypothetical protein